MESIAVKEKTRTAQELRTEIQELVEQYVQLEWPTKLFEPGKTPILYAGRVFDSDEVKTLVEAALDFWLTSGRFSKQFEDEFAKYFNVNYALLCNSGSSANLLALSALTSIRLGDKRLRPGDEVITLAAGFPSTVNPIIQNKLVPVFLDIELPTYSLNVSLLEQSLSSRTKAIMMAHTLGNPFNLKEVQRFVKKHDLWLIEDNCDAVGSLYNNQLTGTFGHLATVSFYPAHHITMGEGGCVLTNDPQLKIVVESFRDWGRDCYCKPGKDNTCGRRFEWQLGSLPYRYDHKFIYSHLGYNLKVTDMQAAIGVAQLKKLPRFVEARRHNWRRLHSGLKRYEEFFILPEATVGSDPSWFGFLITVRENAPFSRGDLVGFLEDHKIATRLLFGGNLTRQPAYQEVNYRVVGSLAVSDMVMNQAFWIGVYPGLTEEMIDYILNVFEKFMSSAT